MSSGSKLHGLARTLVYHFDLYGQLVSVEWKEEQSRLTGMLISLFLCFTFFIFLLFALSSIVIMLSWDTDYRNWAMLALGCFYALGLLFSWYRFKSLGKLGNQAFSATREELAVDIGLLRNKIEP